MTGTLVDRPSGPSVDRRIRARRIEVRRSEARRRLHRLVAVVVVSLVVLIGWGITRSPLLDVDHIEVVGAMRTPVTDVLDRSGITTGAPLVDLDVGAAAEEVAALPWIADVSVERTWGGTVTVTVSERSPAAVVIAPDGAGWLVDASGAVLSEAGTTEAGTAEDALVPIEGLDPPAPGTDLGVVSEVPLGVVSRLRAPVVALVAAIEVQPDGVWIRLEPRPGETDVDGGPRADGGRVRLGDGRELDEQVRSLSTVLEQVDLRDLVVLDVRVPSNAVVTRTVSADPLADEASGDDAGEVAR